MFYVEQSLGALLPGLAQDPIMGKLRALKEEYFKWNKTYNISSIRDEKGFWEKHIIDSLCLSSYVQKEFATGTKIFDIGSGGGFPGLVLAIVLQNKICMVEPVSKKIGFIEHAILKLRLKNAEILKSRYEDIKDINDNFLVVSRALGNYKDLKRHFLEINPDSKLIIMGTKALAEETGGVTVKEPYSLIQQAVPALNGHVLLIL